MADSHSHSWIKSVVCYNEVLDYRKDFKSNGKSKGWLVIEATFITITIFQNFKCNYKKKIHDGLQFYELLWYKINKTLMDIIGI